MPHRTGHFKFTPLDQDALLAGVPSDEDQIRLLNQGGGASGIQRTDDLNIPGYTLGEVDVTTELDREHIIIPATYRLQILSWPHSVGRVEVRIGSRDAPPVDVTKSGRIFLSAHPFDRFFLTTEDNPKQGHPDEVLRYMTGTLQVLDKRSTLREPDFLHASKGWPALMGTQIAAPQTLGDNTGQVLSFVVDRTTAGVTELMSSAPAFSLIHCYGSIQSLLASTAGNTGDAEVVFDDPNPSFAFGSFVSPRTGTQIYYFDNIQVCKDVQKDISFRVNSLGPAGNSWRADVKIAIWDQGA